MVSAGFIIIYFIPVFLIKVSNPSLNVCRLSFVFNSDILVCSLQILYKSVFTFGFYIFVDYNLAIDLSTMSLFR